MVYFVVVVVAARLEIKVRDNIYFSVEFMMNCSELMT